MSALFEARIIDIKWLNKEEVSRINVSKFPIEIEQVSTNTFELETTVYSKLDSGKTGLFAIKLHDTIDATPYFKIDQNQRSNLTRIQDPISGGIWWFAKDKWIKDQITGEKKWSSELVRTVGKVYLHVGHQECTVTISALSFSEMDLDKYLISFRNDFLELILDDSSYVKGAGKVSGYNIDIEVLNAFSNYIQHAEKVLLKPKVELREIQHALPKKKLRPVARSFMEIATKGIGTKLITSRAYQESLNTPENRYLLYTLERTFLIIKSLLTVSGSLSSKLNKTLGRYQQKLEELSDFIEVDKNIVFAEVKDIESHIKSLQQKITGINHYKTSPTSQASIQGWSVVFFITGVTGWEQGPQYFVKVKSPEDENWFSAKDSFFTLQIDDTKFASLVNAWDKVLITGNIDQNQKITQKGRNWYQFIVKSVSKVEVIESDITRSIHKNYQKLTKFNRQIFQLEKNNWKRPLNPAERDEQNRERESLQKLNQLTLERKISTEEFNRILKPFLPRIKAIIQFLKQKSVRSKSLFPNSMSFIQNAHYQGIHSQYKAVKSLSGFDSELFDAIEEIEEVGLVAIANLYERWCLLQVIIVLIHKYDFRPEENWKKPFIKAVLKKQPKNIQVKFSNKRLFKEIHLTFECELDNKDFTKKGGNTRPDIVLDVFSFSMNEAAKKLHKRLVLDAKFKDYFKSIEDSSEILKELYFDKDYREQGKNSVFILHPSQGSIKPRRNPLLWGKSSCMGEIDMFDWEVDDAEGNPNTISRAKHFQEYGSIYVSPTGNEDPLDNLQRVIGMFMQYSMEDNDLDGKISKESEKAHEIVPEGRLFCIACGSDQYSYAWKQTKNGWKLWTTCQNCNHFSVYNYCGNCRTRLIKNGSHWTYHSTEPLEPLNVKCPKCGGLL